VRSLPGAMGAQDGSLTKPLSSSAGRGARSRRAIVAALADRHPKDELRRTLMRLAFTDQVVETGGKYVLATPEDADQP
jgi:hypothetical protein